MTFARNLRIAEGVLHGATFQKIATSEQLSLNRVRQIVYKILYRVRTVYRKESPPNGSLKEIRERAGDWLRLLERYRKHVQKGPAPADIKSLHADIRGTF